MTDWAQLQAVLAERVLELKAEATEFHDPPPPSPAIETLMGLAQALLPLLRARQLADPRIFLRTGGQLELVVQSALVSRRFTVHIAADGQTLAVYLGDSRGVVEGPFHVPAGGPVAETWIDWLCR